MIFLFLICYKTLPALSQVINADRYATMYCQLRRYGVADEIAIKIATAMNIEGKEKSIEVHYYGKKYRLDVLASQSAALRVCPEYYMDRF